MKDDCSQDEKNFSKMNQSENSSSVNDDSLDWAKQAYLQLKQKQKEEKELCPVSYTHLTLPTTPYV